MPLALLLYLTPMRLAAFNGEREHTREEVLTAAAEFCKRHNFTYPGDETVRSHYNAIVLPSLRRELGIM